MDFVRLLTGVVFPLIVLGFPFCLICGILWRIFKKLK